jgi:hypothetical protein
MDTQSSSLDEVISRLQDLVRQTNTSVTRNPSDGSWYLAVSSETTLHLAHRDNKFALSQSDRGSEEDLFFESSHLDALDKFLTYMLCAQLRADNGLPFLLVVPVPLTVEDVAGGFSLSRNDTNSWVLSEDITGIECMADFDDLVEYSHYARLSFQELCEACQAPEGLPPFFPLR